MIRFVLLLLICTNGIQVSYQDWCSCSELSQYDCERDYCKWNNNTCTSRIPAQPDEGETYCNQIGNSCAQTNGCAWIDNKCTHFAGCTAYVKTTTRECHQISNRCISNGKACIEALECIEYSKQQCTTTPNKFGRNCMWSKENCRDYHCSEADQSFNTDEQCNMFLNGCVTTGAGCIEAPLPPCSEFKYLCNLMKGSDGFCEMKEKCQPRKCENAPKYLSNDQDCQLYQIGCVTTGKGCTSFLEQCSTYRVIDPKIECKGYKGIDGVCEGDKGSTTCRSKICENELGQTDEQCNQYKQGCYSNGKYCVSIRQKCSYYIGTMTTCQQYYGIDGRCKGTQNSKNCSPKDCIEDSDNTYTTDELCQQKIQKWCLSTRKGCVKLLQSCNTYKDEGDCFKRIGELGQCKSGKNGYCDVQQCSEALNTLKTNEECNAFQKGCITNGNGCIDQSTCSETQTQGACDGTYENQLRCYWSGHCIERTSCSVFNTKSLCKRYSNEQNRCFWDNNYCRKAKCQDFLFIKDFECDTVLKGCVSNGKSCADPNDCSQFQGSQKTCLEYKAKCTNLSDQNTKCIKRTCENAPNNLKTDQECLDYLADCLTNGNGCIHISKDCSFYKGNKETCKNFNGNNKSIKCWSNNSSDDTCIEKTCVLAENMSQDSECEQFLTGCRYNGFGSCIHQSASCSSYKYRTDWSTCQIVKGDYGKTSCWDDSNNTCRNRQCSDYAYSRPSNSECNTFMEGCITDGSNCVPQTTTCDKFKGSIDECETFRGNSIQCTKVPFCKSRICSEKIDAKSNRDCQNYHSKCRLPNLGVNICKDAKLWCKEYIILENQSLSDKYSYCNTITTSTQKYCSFDSNVLSNCVERKYCSQWSIIGQQEVDCANYLGNKTCSLNSNDNQCYAIGSCSTYQIPNAIIEAKQQLNWCNSITNQNSVKCLYDPLNISKVCTDQQTCENTINPTSPDHCQMNCQFISYDKTNYCIKTQQDCSSYSLDNVTIPYINYCSNLKANNDQRILSCKYDENINNHCVTITCSDLGQAECLKLEGCKYNFDFCYEPKNCDQYQISGSDLWQDRIICQNFTNQNQQYCSYSGTGNNCSDPIFDCKFIKETSLEACGKYRLNTGKACTHYSNNQNCDQPTLDPCSTVINIGSNSCDLYTSIGFCKNVSGNCVIKPDCSNQVILGSSPDETLKACQYLTNQFGQYCTWKSNQQCENAPQNCQNWNQLTITNDNTAFCELRIDQSGNKCTYDMGTDSCRKSLPCEFAKSPKSQIDCDIISKGCFYIAGTCQTKKSYCNQYRASGNTDLNKLEFCNRLIEFGFSCTFVLTSRYCTNLGDCSSYLVSQLASSEDKIKACSLLQSTSPYGCTNWNNNNTCSPIGYCNTYKVSAIQDLTILCGTQKDLHGKICYGNQNADTCSSFRSCEEIIGAISLNDCNKYIDGCVYNEKKCFTKQKDCQYPAPGNQSVLFCSGFADNGDLCTAANDSAFNCQIRSCSDDQAKKLTKNSECKSYKSTCKSDGIKCIDTSTKCSQISANDCTVILDSDNVSFCDQQPNSCINKDCNINDISQSNNECQKIRNDCVTNGMGCVESTVSCSEYVGTIEICKNYIGNNIKCWGNSHTIIDYCRNIQCTDNKTSTNNADCQSFLDGCVTTGQGCVKKGSPCYVYNGNQETCSQFIGINYNCWSLSIDQIQPCVERACIHQLGTTNQICSKFMPSCVTNGKQCVPQSTICSQFQGNYKSCGQFTAADGPCKSRNYLIQESNCTQKICNEARNSLHQDSECQIYHPSCLSTGHGCIEAKSRKCSDRTQQSLCNQNSACLWVEQCQIPLSSCESINSRSLCMNTRLSDGISKCSWNDGKCRQFSCEDYDNNISTHEICQSMNPSCTTNGAGCVKLGICIQYSNPSICNAAFTTESSKRCNWDDIIGQCRQRQCTDDTSSTTNDACDQFLKGCKTRGWGCIDSNYTCSDLNTQKVCLSDSFGNPCLFVKGKCYYYSSCTDVLGQTLSDCQAFNSLCVLGPQNCIAAKPSCDQYANLQSCKIDIYKNTCGWLPSGVCQNFSKCIDVQSTFNQDCQNYGSMCITNGINCIQKQLCSEYLIYTACINGGSDGNCIWESNKCRLKKCSDKQSSSEFDCAQFKVNEGQCTTDGVQCILKTYKNCQDYTTKISCPTYANDGRCIFSYPLGATDGNQSCRKAYCQDYSSDCWNFSFYCKYNGKKCVEWDFCSNYQLRQLCNAGGQDGQCVFSPSFTDSDNGKCQKFTECEQANQDKNACQSRDSCFWNNDQCKKRGCTDFKSQNGCRNIYSFDWNQYTICGFINNQCVEVDPSVVFTADDCFSKSWWTFTWNNFTQQCVSCKPREKPIQLDITTDSKSMFFHFYLMIFIIHY